MIALMRVPVELAAIVGLPTLNRGKEYAQSGRTTVTQAVHTPRQKSPYGDGTSYFPASTWLVGRSRGSGGNRYRTEVEYETSQHDVIKKVSGNCTCPVGHNCKHAVSLLLTHLNAEGRTARTSVPEAVAGSDWLETLGKIFAPAEPFAQIALAVEFEPARTVQPSPYPQNRYQRDYGSQGAVRMRPVSKGKKDTWIRTGVTWGKLLRGEAQGLDPKQVHALVDLFLLHEASAATPGTGQSVDLRLFRGATVWPALHAIRDAGIPILEEGTWNPVTFEQVKARAEIVITRDPAAENLTVKAELHHPALVPDCTPLRIGHPFHGLAWRTEGTIHVAQLEEPASEQWRRLEEQSEGVTVPATARKSFEEQVFPRIARVSWSSPDASFTPPPPPVDALHLTVGFRPRVGEQEGRPPHAILHWSWIADDTAADLLRSDFEALELGVARPSVTVDLQRVGQRQWTERLIPFSWEPTEKFVKDASRLAKVGEVLKDFPTALDDSPGAATAAHDLARELGQGGDAEVAGAIPGSSANTGTGHGGGSGVANTADEERAEFQFPRHVSQFRGLDAVRFAEQLLPRLKELGVKVRVVGEIPNFREESAPSIQLEAAPGEGGTRDWLDLNLTMKVGEHKIPMPTILTALTRKEKVLFLVSGEYVRLDNPELERLRELLDEALQLTNPKRKGLRVPQVRLSWWEDLFTLAIVEKSADSWLGALQNAIAHPPEPAPLPSGLTAELRPYQREGFEWLSRLRRSGLGGVLADDMGLGKTVQTLAMIQDERENPHPYSADVSVGASDAPESTPTALGEPTDDPQPEFDPHNRGPWLVVAPTSVVANWAAEARKFTPNLNVVVVDSTAKKRGTPLSEVTAGADIVVTSYTLLRLDHDEYAALSPVGLVLDEAQQAKNPASKTFSAILAIKAPTVFAITGTPMENNLGELWAMFALTAPGLLGNAQQFRDKIQRPIEKGAIDTSAQFSTLRRRIAPFLLRRTKELVASELPAKQEQIIQVELAPAHRRLYDRQLQRERQRVLHLAEDIEHNQVEVLSALTRLRQVSIDPALVDTEASAPSSKLDVLLPLLEEATQEGHRTLVFSQFTTYLRMIAARLDAAGVKYSYLDGSTTNRRKVIDGFAGGDDPVFLISLKAGGVGLNLTMADYVIICDPWWNPAVEAQAVDRTHRIGQTRSVHVYRLVSQDTIEEKVLALQDAKRQLVAEVLLGDDPAASQPTASTGSDSAQEVEGSGVAADTADAKGAGVSAGTGVVRKPRAVGGSRLSAEDLHMLLS